MPVKPLNELFYLPLAGAFALKYVTIGSGHAIPDNMLATGPHELKRFIPAEPNAKKFTLDKNIIRNDLYRSFALIRSYGEVYIVFRDDVTYYAEDAVRFDEDSVIFRSGDKFYYRRVECPAKEIELPTGISLPTIRVYMNRIAFQTEDYRCIYFGDIKWK